MHKASAAGSVPAAVRTKQEAVELGQSRRFRHVRVASAYAPQTADIDCHGWQVASGPKSDIAVAQS